MLARWSWFIVAALLVGSIGVTRPSQAASPASDSSPDAKVNTDGLWPRTIESGGIEFTVYQPQPRAWDGYELAATAAVAARASKEAEPTFGSIELVASALVNKDDRTVTLQRLEVKSARFPSERDGGAAYRNLLSAAASKSDAPIRTLELDRLESTIAGSDAKKKSAPNLKNEPPRIVFAREPTMLIYVDGAPVWQAVAKTSLQRVLNTRPLLLRDEKGVLHLKIFDGWMETPSLEQSWTVTLHPSQELTQALEQSLAAQLVDPLTGTNPSDTQSKPPSLKAGAPRILVATTPTELIVTEGAPKYVPITGTDLLYVENTTGNVFQHTAQQKVYVLVAGRWFAAASEQGPWSFVSGDDLPKDFRRIPDDNAKENVKASVPGTPQAEEALIANSIPQTAKVDRKTAFTPRIDGEPRLEPVQGTTLYRVANSSTPIIRVDEQHFYAVENGVWFAAPALGGPWTVATSIPAVIYTIPASSPIYYVTYVYVYDVTPSTVVVGYTPGYYGAYVYDGAVVYGTGYYYTPWVGSYWYGPPVTYGFGVAMAYTPWTGWSFSFGFGWSWGAASITYGGWGYGPRPWWGPVGVAFYSPAYYPWSYRAGGAVYGARPGSYAAWGPGGWSASTGNVYHRWGATSAVTRSSGGYDAWTGTSWNNDVGRSYNSRTGTLSAGQRSSVGNVYSGNYRASSSGASVNTRTGGAVAGGRVTSGNAYTGQQTTAGAAAARNPTTGQVTTAAGVRGENGGVARVGDDLYVGNNGNVVRHSDAGWQERDGQSWKNVQNGGQQDRAQLDRAQQGRSSGERRYQGYSGGAHRGGGGFGRGRR
jgi:hypothetical protein